MKKDTEETITAEEVAASFNLDLIKKYPKSNRRLSLMVSAYGLHHEDGQEPNCTTVHISPYGIQFRSNQSYPEGTLLKIQIAMPDYWSRKQKFVDYGRIDTPEDFKVLAKVITTEDVGKRGKKKMVLVKTVNMDDVDEEVLKSYLQDN
ncbi:MAG: PilZ domain-containing protein [Oligoflexales bacterium]